MLGTGKIYGLKNNSLIDERRDPVKSTWAAARYLKDLYDIYQDWNLVLAAYNCGPGTINKAIRRAGGATDYWTIYNYLPKETRGYVPAFIAANYIMTYIANMHLSHGNTAPQRYRHHSHKQRPPLTTSGRSMQHQPRLASQPEPPNTKKDIIPR